MTVPRGALGGIGNTPLVSLQHVVPPGSARILVKLEWANPTGSMKDRMAQAAIQAAAADGRLAPGDTVVEYTAGTTGDLARLRVRGPRVSAARRVLRCLQRREAAHDAGLRGQHHGRPQRRRTHHRGAHQGHDRHVAGAELHSPDIGGATSSTTTTPPRATCPWARRSGDSPRGRSTPSSTRWARRTPSTVVARALRTHRPDIAVTAVEPAESAVLSGGPPARTASRASASASCRLSGSPTRWMASSR